MHASFTAEEVWLGAGIKNTEIRGRALENYSQALQFNQETSNIPLAPLPSHYEPVNPVYLHCYLLSSNVDTCYSDSSTTACRCVWSRQLVSLMLQIKKNFTRGLILIWIWLDDEYLNSEQIVNGMDSWGPWE